MRYLKTTKHGTWQFRFQIPPRYRHLFSDTSEVKKSLGACNKQHAVIESLRIELSIRQSILTQTPFEMIHRNTVNLQKGQNAQKYRNKNNLLSPTACLKRYIDSKHGIVSDKAVKMSQAKITTILSLLNKQKITEIRRLEAEEVRHSLLQYPVNAQKLPQFKGKSSSDILTINQTLKRPTLSQESVKDYIQKASSFFEWCVQMELTDINPFKGMKFKKTRKDSEAKNAYIHKDLARIFSTDIHTKKIYKHSYCYWLPLLGCLTGARLNELCQLYKDDIYQEDGIWVIRIDDRFEGQKLKNTFSRRTIPIHQKLIDLGFIDYAGSVDHSRVFPELKDSRDGFGSAASKWFGRFKLKLGFDKGHDFHSFRHTFATELKNADISSVIAGELLGHAQQSITYDRYGKTINVTKLKQVVDQTFSNIWVNNGTNQF
ncbi:TPA: site-specific integrase [Vibrio parahaemolyticus]|nr:site-specific integrase [Vibrio parahaemolyticus]HCE2134657.1 site-specific integrase [Vibrio parahaemolyticus]